MLTLAQQSFDWRGPLEEALASVIDFVPKAIAFLAILLIGRWVAKLIQKGVTALLAKIRFDDVMDRAGIGGPLENAGFADSGRFIALLVYYGLMLLVLQLALSVFGPNAINDALDSILAFLPKAVVAIAIIIITGIVANAVSRMLEPAFSNMEAGDILRKVVTGAIWVIGVFAALDQVDIAPAITTTLFTALVGSVSLILVIKFGVGGIWAARDRFWPAVYDRFSAESDRAQLGGTTAPQRGGTTPPPTPPTPPTTP